jgi:magnesium transporter
MSAGTPPIHESAGEHLLRDVLTASREETVADVVRRLRVAPPRALAQVYVIDDVGCLLGQIPTVGLLAMPDDTKVGACAAALPIAVEPATDQEHVASLAVDHSLGEVPVVSGEGRLLGVVPSTALIDILRREHIEDMRRFVGVLKEDDRATHALQASPLVRLYERLPWLLVGLAGSVLATALMASYERVLSANVAVAFFVPALVYLADAIGTQTEAAAVRYMSFHHPSLRRLLLGELATGFLIGSALASVVFPLIYVVYGGRLAVAACVALVAAGTTATTTALVLPWVLYRLRLDPALGSGPVSTIVQDVLSLLVYFWTVSLLVA